MQQELFEMGQCLEPSAITWRAEHPDEREPLTGRVRTRSRHAALITAAVELLYAVRYGLSGRAWRIRLWDGARWSQPRTARVMAAAGRVPRRVYLVGIGVYDEHGEIIPSEDRRAA